MKLHLLFVMFLDQNHFFKSNLRIIFNSEENLLLVYFKMKSFLIRIMIVIVIITSVSNLPQTKPEVI